MNTPLDIENRAGICRITCGWKKPELDIEVVRRYWRDVHSPGIARRPGIWEYRHFQYNAVRPDLFPAIDGITMHCPPGQQLMWQSDVRYEDEAALAAFAQAPDAATLRHLLGDIELIVDQSTTYKVLGRHARTLVDRVLEHSSMPVPQGPVACPTYSVFFRQRGEEGAFRAVLGSLAERWATTAGVRRVRLSLFEVPDMEAERKAGYPVKTHPIERQYQALIDLSIDTDAVATTLMREAIEGLTLAEHVHTIHAYPTRVVYTSNYQGRPTFVGLRGYPAFDAMQGLDAANQREAALLQWMYGDVVQEGPAA